MPRDESVPSSAPARRFPRAAQACKACNLRKVRCTIALSGPPCANCAVEGVPCQVGSRKRRRTGYEIVLPAGASESPVEDTSPRQGQRQPAMEQPRDTANAADGGYTLPSRENGGQQSSNYTPWQSLPPGDESLPSIATNTNQHAAEPSNRAEDSSGSSETRDITGPSTDGRVPFYAGDQWGPAFVINICEPHRPLQSNHFLIPMPYIKSLQPEDINYLRAKGAFNLPAPHIREALIQAYFHHCHPFSPILDTKDFLLEYEKGRMSLLLLWSMFIGAGSFIDDALLTDDFFKSRKAMKRAMYQRAKVLYDADYEKDKITLVQSVYLMGHWYNTADDRDGPWHWTGVAIGLAHTVGLHRVQLGTRPLWRRIWWCIYCREVWLSVGMGRPARIAQDDCETLLPDVSDSAESLGSIAPDIKSQYLPEDLALLSESCIDLMKLTAALGNVLAVHYRARGARPTRADIEKSESEIRLCCCKVLEGAQQSRAVASHMEHFKLYFETAIIVLYRPYILEPPRGIPDADHGAWKAHACKKARIAATNTSAAVNAMMAEDLIRFGQTIIVIALVPSMQVHLFESTSSNPMARQMGKHNLALSMIAMEELRRSYISADAACKLFETAINKINNTQPQSEQSMVSTVVESLSAAVNEESIIADVEGWPDGYGMSTAGIVSNVWSPFSNTLLQDTSGTHTDFWLDIQSMDRLSPPGDDFLLRRVSS